MVRARDTIVAERETFFVDADQLPEGRQGRREAGRQDHDIEGQLAWLLGIGEHCALVREPVDAAADGDESVANRVDEIEADERNRIERSVRWTRQHRRPAPLLDNASDRAHDRLAQHPRQLPDVAREILHGNPEDVARNHIRARAHGDRDTRPSAITVMRPRELARDLTTRVPDADDENALSYEICTRPPIGGRVHDLPATALERLG